MAAARRSSCARTARPPSWARKWTPTPSPACLTCCPASAPSSSTPTSSWRQPTRSARCAMGRRIESVTSAEFDALFTSFEHTAYRLETLQTYDVSYEVEPYQTFMAGRPRPADSSKDQWVGMIKTAVEAGKIFQRVHVV